MKGFTMSQNYVKYFHNNSGGLDWVHADDWKSLQDAGWILSDGLGRIYSAKRIGLSLHDAIVEWQSVTGLDPAAEGCNCCGRPHDFTEYDANDNFVAEMVVNRAPSTWSVEK